MSIPRRAGLGLGLVALAAGAALVTLWLAAGPAASPVPTPGPSTAEPQAPPPEALPVLRREAESAPSAPARPLAAGPEASAPRACPDVDAAIDELAALLERTELQVVQVFDPRLELLGGDLDAHCAALAAARADDSTASAATRLAALSLLRVAPGLPDGFALTANARALLWQAFDRGLASPVPALDAFERPGATAYHRDSIARVAGACLSALGDATDVDRLLDRMIDEADLVATRSLGSARSPQVAAALVERLSGEAAGAQVLVALVGMLEDGQGLDPALTERIAQAVTERWQGQEPGGREELLCAIVLGRLDPQLEARLWRERIDASGIPPERVARAAHALARSAAPDDLARLQGWLESGSDVERVAAAVALVQLGPAGDASQLGPTGGASGMRARAQEALEGVVRTAEAPGMRRQALHSLDPGPGRLVPLAAEVLRLDPDEGVRLAAVERLGRHADADPRARELLEWAAAGDGSEAVRRAAARALR